MDGKTYCIILSRNYRDRRNLELVPIRYRSKETAEFCAQEAVAAELELFAKTNRVDESACKTAKHGTHDLWTLSIADGAKPWTFKAEIVECTA